MDIVYIANEAVDSRLVLKIKNSMQIRHSKSV